jgi:hypothetical protein
MTARDDKPVTTVVIGGVAFKLDTLEKLGDAHPIGSTLRSNDVGWVRVLGFEDRMVFNFTLAWSDMQADIFNTDEDKT